MFKFFACKRANGKGAREEIERAAVTTAVIARLPRMQANHGSPRPLISLRHFSDRVKDTLQSILDPTVMLKEQSRTRLNTK